MSCKHLIAKWAILVYQKVAGNMIAYLCKLPVPSRSSLPASHALQKCHTILQYVKYGNLPCLRKATLQSCN